MAHEKDGAVSEQGPRTLEGWFVLHDFRRVRYDRWRALSSSEQHTAIEQLQELTRRHQAVDAARRGSFGLFATAGHKADFLFLHLRPKLEDLIEVERALDQTLAGSVLTRGPSFVSVVELSNYVVARSEKPDPQRQQAVQARLFPALPRKSHVCFYPMNKRRRDGANWYLLPLEQRRALMRQHGVSGKKFLDRVTQLVSGAIGLDDWEWGVTLFADDPLVFKHVVTSMRFDEVSARYAEFGPFYVGHRIPPDSLAHLLENPA